MLKKWRFLKIIIVLVMQSDDNIIIRKQLIIQVKNIYIYTMLS